MITIRVKLLVPICGPAGSFKAGDEPDLPEALAKALIKDGHAESLEPKAEPSLTPVEIKLPVEAEPVVSGKPAKKRR